MDSSRKRGRAGTLLTLSIMLSGCGEKEITGQAFVVTKGKDNIKLALVAVGAIPQEDFDKYIKAKQREKLEQQKPLSPQYDQAKKEANKLQKKLDEIRQRLIEPERNLKEERDNLAKSVGDYSTAYYGEGVKLRTLFYIDTLKACLTEEKEEIKKYPNMQANLDLINKYEAFNKNEFYLPNLPDPKFISKTDAEGKFTLKLPSGKYVITANTSRDIFGSTENYRWLVTVDTSNTNQPLMLSNDNLLESKCNECVKF